MKKEELPIEEFLTFRPILSKKIACNLLSKRGIEHIQANYEADYELACFANELNAVVLSDDSDFYVYDLQKGFINFNQLKWKSQRSSNYYYLECREYNLELFLSLYNDQLAKKNKSRSLELRKEMLAIFAAMCGNDYVNYEEMDLLQKAFKSSENKMIGNNKDCMLEWLAQFNSTHECVETMQRSVLNAGAVSEIHHSPWGFNPDFTVL